MLFPVEWLTINGEKIMIDAIVYFLWSIWTGWIFSTVGAFGGIMAGFGHITILGLGSHAGLLRGTNINTNGGQIDAGNFLADNIRLSNKILTFTSGTMTTTMWYLQKRLVWAAGLSLGLGAFIGAQAGVWLTGGKLGIQSLMGIFGLLTLVVSGFMFYNASPSGSKNKSAGKKAAERFQEHVKQLRAQGKLDELEGIRNLRLDKTAISFEFYGEQFRIAYLPQILVGMLVGAISAIVGVGGGFLYVPILAQLFGLPFFIVPGASALAVLVSMFSGIIGWLMRGVAIAPIICVGMAGVLIGAAIGPKTQRYLPMRFLYLLFGILAGFVGLRYVLKGFFNLTFIF